MDIQVDNLVEDEPEVMFFVEGIQVNFEGYSQKISLNGNLFVYEDGYKIVSDDKFIFTKYAQTSSFGTNQNILICFIDSTGGKEENDEETEELTDSLIKLIKQEKSGNFCLQGNLTLNLVFGLNQLGDMKECYEKMSQFLGEIDEGASKYDEDEQLEEMISADDIDENGNIINRFEEDSEQSSGEDQKM